MENYSALLRNASTLTIVSDWHGKTMPIHDLEQDISGIHAVDATPANVRVYDLQGRQLPGGQSRSKLVVRVKDGKGKKVLNR